MFILKVTYSNPEFSKIKEIKEITDKELLNDIKIITDIKNNFTRKYYKVKYHCIETFILSSIHSCQKTLDIYLSKFLRNISEKNRGSIEYIDNYISFIDIYINRYEATQIDNYKNILNQYNEIKSYIKFIKVLIKK